jgi:PAS domain S-box-containing protein
MHHRNHWKPQKASPALAQHIIDVSPNVIWIYDLRQRKNVFVNRGVGAALGYPPGQSSMEPEFVRFVMHPDDRHAFLDHIAQVARLSDEETAEFEYRMRHRSGAWRWFHCRSRVFTRNEDGSAREVIGTAADITDRKNSEDRARFMADLHTALLPLADPDEIMSVTVRMLGQYLNVDRCGYAEYDRKGDYFVVRGDYTRGPTISIVGRYPMSEFADREREILRENHAYVVNDIEAESPPGTDLSIYGRGQIRSMVCVPLKKNGDFVARMAVHQKTPRRWSSEEIQLITTVADRCWESVERSRVMRSLKESEERFAKAFRISPNALVISRIADGVLLEVNESFVSLSGYSRDELIGKSTILLDLYADPADRERALAILKERKSVRDFEFKMKRRSGEVRSILFSADPLDLHGEHCWLTIGYDITERKQAEEERERLLAREKAARAEAEAANGIKDTFLATMSHELRTPLTSIMGWACMLKSGSLSESQSRRAVQVIEQSAKSQARLVDDILDVSRIITGRFKLDLEAVEIDRVFRAAVEVIRPTAEAKRITLDALIDDAGSIVRGNADRLQQVIWNLLSNAVKFTNEGGRIETRLKRLDNKIEISVTDNGIGIDSQFMPYVFERFRQADSTSTRRYGGLGLGLAVVRHVVELHGGTVSASSAGPGRGATFTLTIPLATVSLPLKGPHGRTKYELRSLAEPTPVAEGQRLVGVSVLVVEDDPDTLEMLKFVLADSGAEVFTAGSTSDALKALECWRPDALISDLAMPDEDGYELIAQVRSRSPRQGGDIPAIALSAYTRAEDSLHALAAGFQMHVPKPVEPETLLAVVASLTGKK